MSTPLANVRVAIVGSGPAGFYAAEALQKAAPGIAIDLIDRLPTPFGLVRGGVAPDHPKIKSVTRIFDRIASQPGFRCRSGSTGKSSPWNLSRPTTGKAQCL